MSHKTVDTTIICTWLGISREQWPPDHYTLLGLSPGEKDADRIERQVQQRLEQVRRYQLTNPEPATEAMNRIAQAFVCLTDPQARRNYDRILFGDAPPAASGSVPLSTPTPLPAVLNQPGAAEPAVDPEFLALVEEEVRAAETAQAAALRTVTSPTTPLQPEAPPSTDPTPDSSTSRKGLGTRRALYQRIVQTRGLMQQWDRVGKYLGQVKKRLSRPSEARDLIDLLTAIRNQLKGFPPLLGEAGQPGYLVLALARQPAIVPTFQTLLPSQREALSRDWASGLTALKDHQSFLRAESRALRRKSIPQRLIRAFRAFLNEHPAGWLIVLGVVALAIVLLRQQFLP